MKKLIFLFLFSIMLCGCSTLDYVGEDYSTNNVQTVKTNEDFVFSTYKKSLNNANIRIGISRTPVAEILAMYVQVENLSNETPYVFRVDDLDVSDPESKIQFITSNNYLSIYQTQEANSMNSMASVGTTITNMAGMSANYNEYNQSMAQNASQQSNQAVFSRMEQLGDQILKHTIKVSSTISPRRSQYYYFFFENKDKFPITVKYKGLNYQFKL